MQRSVEECIEALREAAGILGKSPTKAEYEELGLQPASGTLIRVLGGWNEAKRRAGLETNPSHGPRVEPKPEHVELPPGLDWECLSVDQRWHYRNTGWNTERTLRRRARLRAWVSEQKQRAGCRECDTSNPAVLEFHHIDPAEKKMAIVDMVTYGYGREKLETEIEKCAVLCANCHRKEHGRRWDDAETRRGWYHQYKHKHGCSTCGETDPRSLVFHHTSADRKRMTVAQMITDCYPVQEIKAEIENCELLCANCHRKEHFEPPLQSD